MRASVILAAMIAAALLAPGVANAQAEGSKGSKAPHSPTKTSKASKPAAEKTIHTGPRGGRYYYSSSGKKVYIKRGK